MELLLCSFKNSKNDKLYVGYYTEYKKGYNNIIEYKLSKIFDTDPLDDIKMVKEYCKDLKKGLRKQGYRVNKEFKIPIDWDGENSIKSWRTTRNYNNK